MQRDFLESVQGRLLAYRKRKRRAFEFWWSGKLQSKRSSSPEISAEFQTKLLKQMRLYDRNGSYTGRLMVEIQFWVGSRNPPEVHQLAKHYLDLLQAPVSGVSLPRGRKRLIVRDDAQIEFLSCLYDTRMDRDGLRIRIRRMSDFFEDLELYSDIAGGRVGSRFEFGDDQFEDMRHESAIEHYRDFRDHKQNYVDRFGLDTVNSLELIWKRDAQEAFLSNRHMDLRTISSFLAPRYHPLRKRAGMSTVLRAGAIMTRSAYQYPFMSVDFGARAVKKGESKEFKERVQRALLEAKRRTPLLDPLLAPTGITVLYLPPRNASKIDLDNLMRESIIPSVHDILHPPGSPRDFLIRINSNDADPSLAEMLERYKRAPKFHITGYQVFCLPRMDEDPENGNVRLILHGGDEWKTPWELLDDALTKWEESEPED